MIIPVYQTEVRHKKIPFDLGRLYELMHDWLDEEGFGDEFGGDNYLETYYFEDRGEVSEIWFWWRSRKGTDTKYFTFHIDIDVHCIAFKKVEVNLGGKKLKLDNGEIIMNFNAYIEFDDSGFKRNPFIKFFYEWFIYRGIKRQAEVYKQDLKGKVFDLISTVKKYLNLLNFIDNQPAFHPQYGIGY